MSTAAATLSPSPALSNDPARNPFEVARSHLIAALVNMRVPAAHAVGDASDHIKDAANLFDEWLFAIGGAVQERVNADLDFRTFQGVFLGAVEGDAAYAVKVAVEESSRYRTLRRAR